MSPATDPGRARIAASLTLFVALSVQVLLVAHTFPLAELWTQTPLFNIDGAAHWYRMKIAVNLAQSVNLVGYDPFFGAGIVGGIHANPAAKLPAAFAVLLQPWLTEIQIWKLYAFAASLVASVCVPLALHWLRLGPASVAIGAVLGMTLWWASMLRWFHTAGLVSFVLVAYLALPYLAGVIRYLRGDGASGLLIALGATGAVLFWSHPLFVVPVAVGTLGLVFFERLHLQPGRLARLMLVVPFLAVLPNLPWLYFIFFEKFHVSVDYGIHHQTIVDPNIIWMEVIGLWRTPAAGSKLNPLLAFATAWAFFLAHDQRTRTLVKTFAAAGVFLILYGALGASVQTFAAWTQPNRFSVVGYLFLCVPAALGIAALARGARGGLPPRLRLGARASLILVLLVSAVALNEVRREVSYAPIGHYGALPPEVRPLGGYSHAVLEWLRTRTSPAGRVLFETSNGRVHDRFHAAAYYAYEAGREFIGGPYPLVGFASIWDGHVFGKPIDTIPVEEFNRYLDLYNVGWIIAHSAETKRYLEDLSGIVLEAGYRQLAFYRIERPLSYFIKGGGRVAERGHNRLVIANLSGDEVILKYHHVAGLASEPAAQVEPAYYMDDPNPFVRIRHPPPQVRLYLP